MSAVLNFSRALGISRHCLRRKLQHSSLSQSTTIFCATYVTSAGSSRKTRKAQKLSKSEPSTTVTYEGDGLEVPPLQMWKDVFPPVKESAKRIFLHNEKTAAAIAEAIAPSGSKDLIIVEAAPGPGVLTRALLNLPQSRIKKLIVLEPVSTFLKFLKPLEAKDPRLTVLPYHPAVWATYTKLVDEHHFDDVEKVSDWSQVHPQLRFVMQMSFSVEGEQLASQFLRAISDRQWLFQYGRVPINMILPARMYDRMTILAGQRIRCKASIMCQSVAEMTELVPYDDLQPYSEHFYPSPMKTNISTARGEEQLDARVRTAPRVAMNCIPLENPFISEGELDFWDYCMRKLFVQSATPLRKSIISLGPGAVNLLKVLDNKNDPLYVDTSKRIRDLELLEMSRVVDAFKAWPFRPKDLGIDSMFLSKTM